MNPLMYPAATTAFTNQLQTRRPVTDEARRTALSQALQEKMRSDPRYDQIAAMREQSMTPFGVGAGWTGVAAQLANALAANVGEKKLTKDYQGQQEAKNAQMAQLLELYSPAPVEGAGNGPAGMDGAQQQRIASALDQPDNSGFSINAQRDADPKRAALAALLANPDMQDMAGGMILKSAFDPKEKTKYETVEGPDGKYLVDPTDPNFKPVKVLDAKPEKKSVKQVEMVGPEGPGQYNVDESGVVLGRVGGIYNKPPSTVINNNNGGETAFQKEYGKIGAEAFNQLTVDGQKAPSRIGRYQRFEALLDSGIKTGLVSQQTLGVRKALNEIGLTDDQSISGQEQINSLANQEAMVSLEAMKGSSSDTDRNFVVDAQANLGTSIAGAKELLRLGRKAEERKMQIADLAAEYVAANGQMDAGWTKYINDWSRKNPVFTQEDRQRVNSLKNAKPGATGTAPTQATRPNIRNITVE